MEDMVEASSCFRTAWKCQTAGPFLRVQAAVRCLPILVKLSDNGSAVKLGRDIIDLIPVIHTKLLDRSDQQFAMTAFAGVAANTCALLLATNQPEDALEILERGRAVIIGQLIDLASLRRDYSNIACRYEQLRMEVNAPIHRLHEDADKQRVSLRRLEAMTELNTCIQEIRGIRGYERFLLGDEVFKMRDCAKGGTIVVVNITSFRSDAIIVSKAAISTLCLPQSLSSDAEIWLSKNWTGHGVRKQERLQKNKEYVKYLAWLWEVCVKPILEVVCTPDCNSGSLPRIWWVGSGLGSSMPFHAAGVHSPGSTENALTRVISSYTPSIKALRFAQERERAARNMQDSLLIITMPTTPVKIADSEGHNLPCLPGVMREKEKITARATGSVAVEHLDLPSVNQVVNSLQDCNMVHFACHGSTDYMNPSNNRLILQMQGDQGVQQDWLTVEKVSELSLDHAYMAFLSACSTAEDKSLRLSDEAIHVVSGFQVAGFPHVVGCLWSTGDSFCVDIADVFYMSLFRQRQQGMARDGSAVARALREAVLAVREEAMKVPLAWSQFVHFGA